MGKKKYLIILISTFLTFFVAYFLFFLKIHFEHHDKLPYLFKSIENLNFHKNYSKKLHHLRTSGYWGFNGETESYLFTSINKFSSNTNNILFQGDSWIEQIVSKKKTYNLISNFAKKNNYGLIGAGITSHSPTLMQLQYEILEKNFNIKPNIVVAYIDQSDIGDELCRYKDKRKYDKNNTLIAVRNEHYSSALFDYTAVYNISEIMLLNNSKLKRAFKLTNFFIKYRFLVAIKKLKFLKESGYKNRNVYRCRFDQIQKYLFKSNNNEIAYFEDRVKDYINLLMGKEYVEKIILVTFPHYGHIFGFDISENKKRLYTINVSNIIEKVVKNEEKVYHLNFTRLISDGEIHFENFPFKIGDPGSHLNDEYHANLFMQKIINFLK